MNKKERDKLEKYLTIYLREFHKIYIDGNFREENSHPSPKRPIEDCFKP
jgi:hypothetical protein